MKKQPSLFLVAAALLLSCGDSSTEPRFPGSLAVIDGDGVTSVVGSEQAVRVRVLDTGGRPLPEAVVSWSVASGAGAVTPTSTSSDAAGEARATWTLGIRPGSQTLRASSGGHAVTLAQTALTGPATTLATSEPAPDAGVVGGVVDPGPAVLVTDAYSNPVADVVVSFTVTAGEGSVAAETQVTDAAGVAVAPGWTLGETPGVNRLMASAAGTDPLTFEVEALGAEALAAHAGADQTAVVGTAVPVPPAVQVTDALGNPVSGLIVTFAVTAGEGTVAGPAATTDDNGVAGVAGWTLGTTAGDNTLRASVASLGEIDFLAVGVAAAPAALMAISTVSLTGTAGEDVADVPAVRLADTYDNPVAGVAVTFTVIAGDGSATGTDATTDSVGVARVGGWTLGTVAGPNTLQATASGVDAVEFTATGLAGPATILAVAAGDGQAGLAGFPVDIPPTVRATDDHGNGVHGVAVTFSVILGGGSVSGAATETDSLGLAGVRSWTLGDVGENTLVVSAADIGPVAFVATAEEVGEFQIFVDAVHINQGSQTSAGEILLAAGRPGLLRVVLRANEANSHTPEVRLRLYDGAALLRDEILTGPAAGVPVAPDLAEVTQTWNLPLDAADMVTDLRVVAEADPDTTIPVYRRDALRYPATGTASQGVTTIPPLRLVFFPIHTTVQGTTGSITTANAETFLTATRQWIAAPDYRITVRDPFTTDEDLATGEGWSQLLQDLVAVRTAEETTDEYYHGIIGDFQDIRYGGLAYRLTSASSTWRAGLSYDRFPASPQTVAHELGHNMGRRHAPCGDPGSVDDDYPHDDARLGSPGFDILTGNLESADDLRDYMSYCRPRWSSDYTYQAVLQRRIDDPLAPGAATSAAEAEGVLVWGRIGADGPQLQPVFTLEALPSLPDRPGPETLHLTARDGRTIRTLRFEAAEVADGPADERHFAFFVPLSAGDLADLARVEVRTDRGVARQVARPVAAQVAPPAHVDRAAPGRLRVQWDAATHPAALVRDPATGHILAISRSGTVVLESRLDPSRVEVLLSDGVRSQRSR